MVVRLHNLDKWKRLKAGNILELVGMAGRKVRVQFNCEEKTRLDMVIGDEPTFVAVVQSGFETVEFYAPADAHIIATSEGEVSYFTNDGGDSSVPAVSQVTHTKIMQRRERNPELERMMHKMEKNMARRLALQAQETAELQAAAAARAAAVPKHDPDTGEIEDDEIDNGTTGGGATAPKEPAKSDPVVSEKGAVKPAAS